MSRNDRFSQSEDDIVIEYDPRLQAARKRIIDGEDADEVAADLAAEDVAAELNAEQAAPRHLSSRRETALHKVADKHLDAVTLAVMYGFMLGQRALGNPPNATRAAKAVHDGLLKSLPPALLKVLVDGGDVGFATLPKVRLPQKRAASADMLFLAGPLKTRFDAKSKEAIAWAKEHAGELATSISDTTHDRIKSIIADRLEGDSDFEEKLRDAVGNKDRAEMIARTETMKASNEGLSQSWSQAVDAGLLTGFEKKEWIATADCCDDCDEVDGEQVALDDEFSIGDDPPAHPNCRCTMGIAADDGE